MNIYVLIAREADGDSKPDRCVAFFDDLYSAEVHEQGIIEYTRKYLDAHHKWVAEFWKPWYDKNQGADDDYLFRSPNSPKEPPYTPCPFDPKSKDNCCVPYDIVAVSHGDSFNASVALGEKGK